MRMRGWRPYSLLIVLVSLFVAIASGVATAMPIPAGGSASSHGAPPVLDSSALAVPKPKLPVGGGAGLGGSARSLAKPVREIVADRTATTSTWVDSNGQLSVRRYLAPHFYKKSGSSGWVPISTSLSSISGQAGWWHTTADNWQVAFGPAGAASGSERVTIGGKQIGFSPMGVSRPAQVPSVSGSTATYSDLWPGVNVDDEVSSSGVNEDIVLEKPGTAASFTFRVTGATVRAAGAGSLDVVVAGRAVGVIPAPTVTTASRGSASAKSSRAVTSTSPTRASGVRLTVADGQVRVSVSPQWLASLPASAFPVVIDPSLGGTSNQTEVVSVGSSGGVLFDSFQLGIDSHGQEWEAAAYIPAPTLPAQEPGAAPWELSTAGFLAYCTSSCGLVQDTLYGMPTASSTYPTYSQIPYGQLIYQGSPEEEDAFLGSGSTSANDDALMQYLRSRSSGWWFGATVGTVLGDSLATFNTSQIYMTFYYVEQPPPTTITSPSSSTAQGAVLPTSTPTLTAAPIDTSESPMYDFKISTSPDGTGAVVDSGWLDGTSWTVPAGSLQDGVTYYATVQDAISQQWYTTDSSYVPPAAPNQPVKFTVKERLGDGGPSPTDTIGSSPGTTSTPSQGSPSPGASTASATVDMVTGNLAVAVTTHTVQALSGPVGITLDYNSLSSSASSGVNYGLTGQYYTDSGNHVFTGSPVGQRVDPDVNATWSSSPPVGGLSLDAPFMARWTGVLTLPAGTWELGGLTTGGMRVYLNGSSTASYNDWSGSAGSVNPSFGTTTVSGGAAYQIEVDDWDPFDGGAQVQLWAKNTTVTTQSEPSMFLVPSNWLTPVAEGVPPGWSLVANPATVAWTHAENDGDQVILQAPSGETATFTQNSDGVYVAPPGDHDYLNFNGQGALQLSTSDGYLYTFNPDGSLASMTTIADDLHPTALQYTYSGTPTLLSSITDPVSGRSVTLAYGGNSACPTTNPAPTGMLCQVSYWDGTATTFGYNSNGQLIAVTNPGGLTSSFAYDSDNRLADIRDALANDYLAAGGSAGTAAACPSGTTGLSVTPTDTQVCYNSSGQVATVVQPAPTPGAARPTRTYTYSSGSTAVSIAGFSPSSGYSEKDAYDSEDRITQTFNSVGQATTTVWNTDDLPIVTADPDGDQTSTVYDAYGNVTDTYGPAPLACFSGGWPANVTPTAPVTGYLPVSNPQGTSGCGVAVPHTHNGYDEGITGLAATYWSNGQSAGAPVMHATGTPGSSSSFCGGATGLCAEWAAGSPPVGSDSSGTWSMRLTGTITLPDTGGYDFGLNTSQPISVYIDGNLLLDNGPAVNAQFKPGADDQVSTDGGVGFGAGQHTIEVDYQGSATELNEFSLIFDAWTSSGGATTTPPEIVPASMLDPAYNLKTSTTDADGITTTTSYTNSTLGAQYGLPTSITVGAGSSTALTTTTTYETPGAGSYLRKTSSTLPAGNTTTYAYYTGTGGPVAAACGVTASTPQGGQLEQENAPDPGGGQARVQQLIYNAAGQQAGIRIGTPGDIAAAPWQCVSFDAAGRIAQEAWPAANGSSARTITYNYAVGGNPLVSSVSDASGTITSTVDLLGRAISYTDVWGQTTTTSYDQAGQVTATSGPGGSYQLGYDPNSGLPTTTTVNGTLLATASYDSAGRLSGVAYGNGTSATIAYDASGNQSGESYDGPSGNLLAKDTVTRTPAGRESTDTTSESGGLLGVAYTYDGAGRLIQAADTNGGTQVSSYSYATSPGCSSPYAGENTDRTSVTIGSTTTSYCYNNADQLVSSASGGTTSTGYAYNERGDQIDDNGTTYTWDSSDRVATANTGATTVTSAYDAVDRLVQSSSSTGSIVRYSYVGYSDAPAAVLDTSDNVLQQLVPLPGGVSVTLQSSGNVWSYTNLQGDTTITASSTGTLTAGPVTYDPWGNLNPGQTAPANTTGPNALGAYATSGKLTDTVTGTILLGARTFNPTEARFLSVDPVSGGCANPYAYAFGDPLNHPDLTGQNVCRTISAASAIRLGAYLEEGGTYAGDIEDILADSGLGDTNAVGGIAQIIAAVASYLGEGLGSMIAAAGEAAEFGAAHTGHPGGANAKVILVLLIYHLGPIPVPYGLVPVPIVDGPSKPGPLNPRASQNVLRAFGCS